MAIYVVKDNASATGDRIWEFINAMLKAQEETGLSLVLDKSGSIDLFDNLRNRFVRVKSAGESNYQLSYPYEHDNGRVKEEICGACRHHGSMYKDGKWICKNPKSDLNGVETSFYAGCEEFEEGSN